MTPRKVFQHPVKVFLLRTKNSELRTVSGDIMPTLHIEERYCKGCGICIEFCPTKVLKQSKKMNSRGYFPPESDEMEKCKKCGMCSLLCPDFAIVVSD
jgi:2-oxoglutarate ferredoxin oxidoreductase subunit delta